jgi:hypothetical protein
MEAKTVTHMKVLGMFVYEFKRMEKHIAAMGAAGWNVTLQGHVPGRRIRYRVCEGLS